MATRVQNAFDAAQDFKRARAEAARQLKKDWEGWLYKNPPNIPLLMSNVLYLALCLTVLILTVLIMHEHADDFKRNALGRFRDPTQTGTPDNLMPKPCGIPTPDGMYLLQAIGALPAAGWDGATLEPNYQAWMQKIDRALCSKVIPGVDAPPVPDTGANEVCDGTHSYGENYVEELLTLGYLMNDASVMPHDGDYNDPSAIVAKNTALEVLACVTDDTKVGTQVPFYSSQQFDSYGELKGRVARAYLTAMPGFSRYKKERMACQDAGQGHADPFDTGCKHACHIKLELDAAAADQHAMHDEAHPYEASFSKQLYRLFALSLVGYYDRHKNDGLCFRNPIKEGDIERNTALELCKEAMDDVAPGSTGDTPLEQTEAYELFSQSDHRVKVAGECTVGVNTPPPSPAPPVYRVDHGVAPTDGNGKSLVAAQVCAATLEYGLVEQGRLFGVPDVIMPFVVDNRVHRSFHFVAWVLYTLLYTDRAKDGGLTFADPKAKLELYIAYRLASSSIWAIIVANVAGFMMVRALVPIGVQILKFLGVMSGTKRMKDINGVPHELDEYEPIRLMRPQIGWFIWLTFGVTLLVVYWILWLDPATQSHYYISTTCEDWAGLGVQVPSGAYVTTWGKRRFDRFGEHLIGTLLILTSFVLLFQQFIGRSMVDPTIVEDASKVKLGSTSRKKYVAVALLVFALVIQLFFILQSATSGQKWFDGAKGDDVAQKQGEVYAKDVLMSVWAAFWNAAAIGWYRQKWAVTHLKPLYQYGWMAGCVLLVWMPVFQASALLDREIEVAFKNGKGTEDTERLAFFICILGFSAIWTGLLVFRLREVFLAMPKNTTGSEQVDGEAIEDAQQEMIDELEEAIVEDADGDASGGFDLFDGMSSKQRFKFDLSGVRVGPRVAPARPPSRLSVSLAARPPARLPFAVSGHPAPLFFAQRANARAERKSVHMPLLPRH